MPARAVRRAAGIVRQRQIVVDGRLLSGRERTLEQVDRPGGVAGVQRRGTGERQRLGVPGFARKHCIEHAGRVDPQPLLRQFAADADEFVRGAASLRDPVAPFVEYRAPAADDDVTAAIGADAGSGLPRFGVIDRRALIDVAILDVRLERDPEVPVLVHRQRRIEADPGAAQRRQREQARVNAEDACRIQPERPVRPADQCPLRAVRVDDARIAVHGVAGVGGGDESRQRARHPTRRLHRENSKVAAGRCESRIGRIGARQRLARGQYAQTAGVRRRREVGPRLNDQRLRRRVRLPSGTRQRAVELGAPDRADDDRNEWCDGRHARVARERRKRARRA
jgi:hypothetical protein